MNEIEKSEHKASDEGSKGFDWKPEVAITNGSELFFVFPDTHVGIIIELLSM